MIQTGRASRAHLRRPALLTLALATCALAAGCGDPPAVVTPAHLLARAVARSSGLQSGRIALAVSLAVSGVRQLADRPVRIDLAGPFERTAQGAIAADLAGAVTLGATRARVALDLLPGGGYAGIGGAFYGPGATGAREPAGVRGLLLRPDGWLVHPHRLGGGALEHLRARVDAPKLAADLATLLAGGPGSGALNLRPLLSTIGRDATSARADVYTQPADALVRRLDVALDFSVPAGQEQAFGGMRGGTLDLSLRLTDANAPLTITAPARPLAASQLLNGMLDLESRLGALAPLFAGTGSLAG